MADIYKTLEELKVVPVIKLDSPEQAKPLGQALMNGGLPVAEVTFRTDAAEESIRIMAKEFPDMCVGAGSLATKEQAEKALNAGAKFFVSAGFSPAVADVADANGLPYFAGCCTPTEIIMCITRGYKVVKFFPAKQYGGLDTIKALAAPFPGLKFMPTGGINASNIKEYLASDKIIACGGSWMVDSKLVAAGKYDEIEALVKEAVATVNS